jgi:hypothetical protein
VIDLEQGKGQQMTTLMTGTRKDTYAEFAFERTMRLAGGADVYGDSTKATIWSACYKNETIKTLAGMYLVGSSERAEHNLARLDAKLREEFGI